MLTRIRQWLCSHRYDLADLSRRDASGMVHCRCYKCGGVFTAECGLTLPGVFDRNSAAAGVPAPLNDFRVISVRTDNEVARFADVRLAFEWIRTRRRDEGPHGPSYYVKDRYGRAVPPLPTNGVTGIDGKTFRDQPPAPSKGELP